LKIHKDKYVFAQLAFFMDRNKFNYIVRKYDGDKYVKHFTCWNQLLALMFGQLSNRESLRDKVAYQELGEDYLSNFRADKLIEYDTKQLEKLKANTNFDKQVA